MHKFLVLIFAIINILNLVNAINDNCVCNCDNCDNATITLNINDDDDDAAKCEVKHQLELLHATNEVLLARIETLSVRNSKRPNNCAEVVAMTNTNKSGLYAIQFDNMVNPQPFFVYCDKNIEGDGWLVIQRRRDGSVDFNRPWSEYKMGFGNLKGEFWIGLDKLHALTTQSPQELLIFMENFDGAKKFAKYSAFAIGSESEAYALNVLGKYSGTAGDSLTFYAANKFSTKDVDNDLMTDGNCAATFMGAWWYANCNAGNLNGQYLKYRYSMDDLKRKSVIWNIFRGKAYPLKSVQMMIRPQRA